MRVKSGGREAMVVWSVGNFVNHRKHKKSATATSGMLMFRVGLRDDDDGGVSAGRLDVKCYQFQPFWGAIQLNY